MEAEGFHSFFALSDIAVMGVVPVLARLPTLLRRIRETADKVIAARPDGLVIIDSPDFSHRVARRVRKALPDLPIVDYVSPSVWAWRPGRAKKMRAYVDCVLALLPFEPGAHQRLGGPRCVYVGHPLIERLGELRGGAPDAKRLVVLPGSRRPVIRRMMADFGAAIALVEQKLGPLDVVAAHPPACRRSYPHACRGLANQAAHRRRRSAKIRGISRCARGARGVGHSDAGARARRLPVRRRL